MGRVAGSYGVRGWLKAAPGRGAAQALVAAQEWWVGERTYHVEEAKLHGATVLVKLAGLDSREQALALKGASIALARDALPDADDGRYYLADLIGLEVVNEQGDSLGVIKRMFSNGAQDVMELEGDRERLLPWVPAVVKKVDLPARRIEVQWQADW